MARQSGLIKLKGTLDNVSFYKTKDGDLARMKTSVDKDRIKNDPAFERTRENNAEFGTSAKAGKLVRDGARALSMTASDSRLVSRFTRSEGTRLNSSHVRISYAVFCLKKKRTLTSP